jgi:exopolysaccharide production protein ExoQ
MLIRINYRKISVLLLYLYLMFIYIGLTPFSLGNGVSIGDTDSSNLIRQLIFISFVIISSICNYKIGEKFKFIPISGMIAFIIWIFLSSTWSIAPDISIKRSVLLVFNIICMYNFINIFNKEQVFSIYTKVFLILLVLSYSGLFLTSGAVHVASDFIDSDIIGSWKGIYQHKNQAGPAMVFSIILFSYAFLNTKNKIWLIFILLSFLFLLFTKSKSSLIIFIPSFITGIVFYHINLKRYRMYFYLSTFFIMSLLFMMSDYLFDFFKYLISDPESFTGRAQIWYILTQVIQDHFLLGLGFGSVWLVGDNMIVADYITGWNEWIYTVAHSHNGYFEIFTSVGFIGFVLAMITLVYMPVTKLIMLENKSDKFFFYSIFIFFLVHNTLETDLINSIDGRWIFYLFIYFNLMLNFSLTSKK